MASSSLWDCKFDELPDKKKVWVGSPGSREEGLGRLALLTDERVRKAAAEQIRVGCRVGLDWELTKIEYPPFGRTVCEHKIMPILGGVAFDDTYAWNPQQSSQWDGLRHFGMPDETDPESRLFYGGTTKEEILDRSCDRIGIHHWAREGITGRGILIDYVSWAEKQGIAYSAFSAHAITLKEILQITKECNITVERGDILLVRSGMTKEWEQMDAAAKAAYGANPAPKHAGVEASMDMLSWIWDSGFAAVGGDAICFEPFPLGGDVILHEYMLAGWGMPIGELFDLERLANICKRLNRWTFFFTSMPLNMPGGVSSPPNAQAIF